MFTGTVIFALEIFAPIFAFYGVAALGNQDATLGVILLASAPVSGVLGFALTAATRRQEPDPPLEIHALGRRAFHVDIDELRT